VTKKEVISLSLSFLFMEKGFENMEKRKKAKGKGGEDALASV